MQNPENCGPDSDLNPTQRGSSLDGAELPRTGTWETKKERVR